MSVSDLARPSRGFRALAAISSLVLVTAAFSRTARAESDPDAAQAACIAAYESLQEARARGDLLNSREQAFECASSACPRFMQTDCSAWLEEIESEVPSVSFEVRSEGEELAAVRVFEGDRVVAERVDGAPVELDPGAHWLRFEAEGLEPVTKPIVVARGEKNQRFSVELPAPERKQRARAQPSQVKRESPSAAPWIAGAIGVAGMTGFAILGASGLSQESSLEQSCAPDCKEVDLRSVQTKYLLADISLGVGLTGFLVGGYLLFAPDEPRASARAPSVSVQATPHGGMASVRSRF
jgi:hypothetical protein